MSKQTDVFDNLDNVIGNFMDGRADNNDVARIANKVNDYLKEYPHPHDLLLPEEQKPEPSVPLKDVRAMLEEILDWCLNNPMSSAGKHMNSFRTIAKKHLGVDLE